MQKYKNGEEKRERGSVEKNKTKLKMLFTRRRRKKHKIIKKTMKKIKWVRRQETEMK